MKSITTVILFAAIGALALFATGCPKRVSIADINANPAKFQDKEVAVAGVVKDSYGVSIPGTNMGGGAYKIDDGTGSIWILVTDGNVPAKGAEVGVKGTLSNGVSWKGRNYGLGIHEEDRRYRKH